MAWNDEGLILARAFKAESDALQKIKELEQVIKQQEKELTFYRMQDRLLSISNKWNTN
jgi:hypothetical protein